jgi:hypothetical protein
MVRMGRRFDSGGGLHHKPAAQAGSGTRSVACPRAGTRSLPEVCQSDSYAVRWCLPPAETTPRCRWRQAPVRASALRRIVQAALGRWSSSGRGGQDPVSVPPGGRPRGRRCPCRHRPRPGRRTRTGPAAPAAVRRPARPGRRPPRASPGRARPRRPPALLDRQAFGRLAVVVASGHRQDHAQLDLAGPLLGRLLNPFHLAGDALG